MTNPSKLVLEIRGTCDPQNSLNYLHAKKTLHSDWESKDLDVNIALNDISMPTTKCLFDIFRQIWVRKESGTSITVNWHYQQDDNEMYETGEDYSDLFDLPFKFVVK